MKSLRLQARLSIVCGRITVGVNNVVMATALYGGQPHSLRWSWKSLGCTIAVETRCHLTAEQTEDKQQLQWNVLCRISDEAVSIPSYRGGIQEPHASLISILSTAWATPRPIRPISLLRWSKRRLSIPLKCTWTVQVQHLESVILLKREGDFFYSLLSNNLPKSWPLLYHLWEPRWHEHTCRDRRSGTDDQYV